MKLALPTVIVTLFPFITPANAVNGTPTEVQAAINSAASGGTVTIAPGTYNWSSGINVNKYVKLIGTGVTLNSQTSSTLISITPQSAGSVEISGLTFNGSSGQAAYVRCSDASGKPPLLHDCNFNTAGFGHGCIEWSTNKGVIWNCRFVSTDKADNSGIQFKNDQSDDAWHAPDYLGNQDSNGDKNVYVEDCTFKDMFLQAVDTDDNSRVAFRHCTFDNSCIASHGQETSPVGSRQQDIDTCTFIFTASPSPYPLNLNRFVFIRGGGPWLIHGCVIPNITSSMWGDKSEVDINLYNIRRSSGYVSCQKNYPAARQMGFGSDTNGNLVASPMYFWNNTGGGNYNSPSFGDYNPDECGNNKHTSDFVVVGRDLFLNTAKPGYTAYTYPHPLRTGGGSTPTATPSPSTTPSPTATPPQPSPTPTSPPTSGSFSQWLDQLSDWIRLHPAVPNK